MRERTAIMAGAATVFFLLTAAAPASAQPGRAECAAEDFKLSVIDEHVVGDEVLEGEPTEQSAMEAFVESLNVTPEIKAALDPAKFEPRSQGVDRSEYGRSRSGRTVAVMELQRSETGMWRVDAAAACGELWNAAEGDREPGQEPPAPHRSGSSRAVAATLLFAGPGMALLVYKRRRAALFAACATLVVSLGLLAPGPAVAHCADSNSCGGDYDWYHSEWQADHHTGLSVTWRFTTGFPDGAKKDRVVDAFAKWNALGQKMRFERLGDVGGFTIDCDSDPNSPYHGIFYRDITAAARTYQCDHPRIFGGKGDTLHEFHIEFDSSVNWNAHLDIGASDVDFYSAAVHEVGHATGFFGRYDNGHFDPNGDLCAVAETTRHTMCPSYAVGTTWMRSLEEHDKHTFDNAYPNL